MANDAFFQMKVTDVFSIKGRGTVVMGVVEQGTVNVGDSVTIQGSQRSRPAVVSGVEMGRKVVDKAGPGDTIGVLLKDIQRGEVNAGDVLFGGGGSDFTWKP